MYTAHLLTVSPSMHCSGGCAWSGGLSAPGGVCAPGVPAPGCLLRGVVSQHALRQTPPPHGQNSWHTLLRLRAVIKGLLPKVLRFTAIFTLLLFQTKNVFFSYYSLRHSSRRMYWLVMHRTARQTVIELSLVMSWWAQSTMEPLIVQSYSRYMRLMKIWTGIWARYFTSATHYFQYKVVQKPSTENR